jgi:hypothetical protein
LNGDVTCALNIQPVTGVVTARRLVAEKVDAFWENGVPVLRSNILKIPISYRLPTNLTYGRWHWLYLHITVQTGRILGLADIPTHHHIQRISDTITFLKTPIRFLTRLSKRQKPFSGSIFYK